MRTINILGIAFYFKDSQRRPYFFGDFIFLVAEKFGWLLVLFFKSNCNNNDNIVTFLRMIWS